VNYWLLFRVCCRCSVWTHWRWTTDWHDDNWLTMACVHVKSDWHDIGIGFHAGTPERGAW